MEGEESRRSEAAVEADAEGAGVVVGEFEGEVPKRGKAPLGADIDGDEHLADTVGEGSVAEVVVAYAGAGVEVPARVGLTQQGFDVDVGTQREAEGVVAIVGRHTAVKRSGLKAGVDAIGQQLVSFDGEIGVDARVVGHAVSSDGEADLPAAGGVLRRSGDGDEQQGCDDKCLFHRSDSFRYFDELLLGFLGFGQHGEGRPDVEHLGVFVDRQRQPLATHTVAQTGHVGVEHVASADEDVQARQPAEVAVDGADLVAARRGVGTPQGADKLAIGAVEHRVVDEVDIVVGEGDVEPGGDEDDGSWLLATVLAEPLCKSEGETTTRRITHQNDVSGTHLGHQLRIDSRHHSVSVAEGVGRAERIVGDDDPIAQFLDEGFHQLVLHSLHIAGVVAAVEVEHIARHTAAGMDAAHATAHHRVVAHSQPPLAHPVGVGLDELRLVGLVGRRDCDVAVAVVHTGGIHIEVCYLAQRRVGTSVEMGYHDAVGILEVDLFFQATLEGQTARHYGYNSQ